MSMSIRLLFSFIILILVIKMLMNMSSSLLLAIHKTEFCSADTLPANQDIVRFLRSNSEQIKVPFVLHLSQSLKQILF